TDPLARSYKRRPDSAHVTRPSRGNEAASRKHRENARCATLSVYRRNAVLCVLPTLLTAAAATTGCGGSARPEALRPSNYTLQHSDVGNAYKQDEAGRLSSRKAAIALSLPLSTLRGWGFVGGYERTFGLRDLSRAFGALNTVDSSVFATRTAAGAHSLFVWTIKGYGQQSPRLGIRPVGAESR